MTPVPSGDVRPGVDAAPGAREARPAGGAPLRVRVVEGAAELRALEPAWERLQEQASATSVFETFDWQHLWWATYGRGAPLRVLVATDAAGVVGILPLYVHLQRVARWPVRVLRFLGTGGDTSPDDLGPVLAAGREREVARALADAVLALDDWDVLHLHDLDPRTPFAAELTAAARGAGLPVQSGTSERISYVELPESWDAWLASLHRDRRYRVRKIRKDALAAHPDARFYAWSDGATLDAGVDRLIALHRARWQETGQHHAFSSSEYVSFHRAVMHACFARDRLRLFALELGGQIAAMYYMYRFRGALYLMQTGFDPAHARIKPGHVLLGFIIEDAIGARYRVLDFLKGEHRYKDELATGERSTMYLRAFRPRAGAWVYRARRQVLPSLKAWVLAKLGRARAGHGQAPHGGR